MEHFGNNNITFGMNGNGNQNMFSTVNIGHHDGMKGNLAQGGQMTSFLEHSTELSNFRLGVCSSQVSSTNFAGFRHEQHFSLLSGGSLFVQLNIGGPSIGANNNNIAPVVMETPATFNNSSQHDHCTSCGRKRRTSFSIDLNQIPIDLDQELYCECENHPMTNVGSRSQTEIRDSNRDGATPLRFQGTPVFRHNDVLQQLSHPHSIGFVNHGFTQNLIMNPTQLGEQLRNEFAGENFVGDLNQDQFIVSTMPPNVDASIPPAYEANMVIEISDDENDELQELDDMRLDIDEMTYEELMDLGEIIGEVNTGLTDETLMEHLRRRYYRVPTNKNSRYTESCCICLVDFKNRDVLGKINCIHKMHYDCIWQWLKERNFCPMCKRTALPQN